MLSSSTSHCFTFNETAPTEIYTLSLHDALPICGGQGQGAPARCSRRVRLGRRRVVHQSSTGRHRQSPRRGRGQEGRPDRKSTRLNSSHLGISYAVFCLKKKKRN